MVDVTTINPGTVFAWFMLGMLLRRAVLITILTLKLLRQPFRPGARAPEDKMLSKKETVSTVTIVAEVPFSTDVRVNRVIHNDAENDAYFLILLLATAIFTDATTNVTRTITYGVIYLSARICHAVMYIIGLQPWRTLCFVLGFFCTLACNLDLVITMSRRSN